MALWNCEYGIGEVEGKIEWKVEIVEGGKM